MSDDTINSPQDCSGRKGLQLSESNSVLLWLNRKIANYAFGAMTLLLDSRVTFLAPAIAATGQPRKISLYYELVSNDLYLPATSTTATVARASASC